MSKLYHFFPIMLDNTQVTAFKSCPVSWWYKYVLHLQQESSVHLHFGKSYAKGHEVVRAAYYKEGLDSYTAMRLGAEAITVEWGDDLELFSTERKNHATCLKLLEAYYENYPLEAEQYVPVELEQVDTGTSKYGVEMGMSVEIGNHPTLDLPLFYSGRADMIVKSPNYGSESVLVFDDKTTGSYISANLLASWSMRSQFTGYCWLLQELGINAVGAVVSIASVPKGTIKFGRVETERNSFQVANWHTDLITTVTEMKEFYLYMLGQREKFPTATVPQLANKANYSSCYDWGRPCWYVPACAEESGERLRLLGVEQNIWLPQKQCRVSLKDYIEKTIEVSSADFAWGESIEVDGLSLFSANDVLKKQPQPQQSKVSLKEYVKKNVEIAEGG